jgi:myo-inositol-1-phosphate synthase
MVKIAFAGVGNNASALLQGAELARHSGDAAITVSGCPTIGGEGVEDIVGVAAFDVDESKVGHDLAAAIVAPPNCYPRLIDVAETGVIVSPGPVLDRPDTAAPANETTLSRSRAEIVDELVASKAEVMIYGLPTGRPNAAAFYAECALDAGVAFVNCTPESVAREPDTRAAFEAARLPLLGDDLASHLGSSVVHQTLLKLLRDRGIVLDSTFQLNVGGNADFANLRLCPESKLATKHNALRLPDEDGGKVHVLPSAGAVKGLADQKVAFIDVAGRGWAGTPVHVEIRLGVQDSSNAAGVIADLVRIGGLAARKQVGGFAGGAEFLFKAPAGDGPSSCDALAAGIAQLEAHHTLDRVPASNA